MKAIGKFAELERDGQHPSLKAVQGHIPTSERAAVVAYLKAGLGVLDVTESTADPLNPKNHISGGPSLLTDGKWVWRFDLSHYVEHYGVELPAHFLADVRAWRGTPFTLTGKQLEAAMSEFGWAQPLLPADGPASASLRQSRS